MASTAIRSASRWKCCSRRAATHDYTIHLTYPIDEIDEGREEDWKKEQARKRKKKKNSEAKGAAQLVARKHSLRAFFDEHPKFDKKVTIVDEDKPHLIDLLDQGKF